MFFKNLRVFRLTQALPLDPQAIQEALASKPGSQELFTYGFTASARSKGLRPSSCARSTKKSVTRSARR